MDSLLERKLGVRTADNKRLKASSVFIAVSLMLCAVDPRLSSIFIETLSDAYLTVSVFVAFTLFIVYASSKRHGTDIIAYMNDNRAAQVFIATLLGALPGCGGAIIVVTQFVHGKISFGALVAVLIATMGDASFLLLAGNPKAAMTILATASVSAILFGYLIDKTHPDDFLKPKKKQQSDKVSRKSARLPSRLVLLWAFMLVLGLPLGLMDAFQFDIYQYLPAQAEKMNLVELIGFFGAALSILVWLLNPVDSWSVTFHLSNDKANQQGSKKQLWSAIAAETSFVSVWVILGFLSFELLMHWTGLKLENIFGTLGPLTPLFALLVGFIPGCGPQIIMTTLYLQGVVPLSAQVANSISNDGDALFPAIAIAPKAALYATWYSAIPALLAGYMFYALEF